MPPAVFYLAVSLCLAGAERRSIFRLPIPLAYRHSIPGASQSAARSPVDGRQSHLQPKRKIRWHETDTVAAGVGTNCSYQSAPKANRGTVTGALHIPPRQEARAANR